jgi:uncharacterized membrane protein HdeD (DUF308 family)
MKDKLKSIKLDVTLSAVLSIVIGLLLVIYPGTVITLIARIIALVLVISGVMSLVPQLMEPVKNYLAIIVALLIAMIGLWMFLQPELMASLIPIAIGVLLVVHGAQDISLGLEGRKNKASNWWSILVMAVVNIALGALCICNAFGLVKVGMILIGIMLVYDGLSDMLIVHKVNKAARDIVDSEIIHEEDLDDFV